MALLSGGAIEARNTRREAGVQDQPGSKVAIAIIVVRLSIEEAPPSLASQAVSSLVHSICVNRVLEVRLETFDRPIQSLRANQSLRQPSRTTSSADDSMKAVVSTNRAGINREDSRCAADGWLTLSPAMWQRSQRCLMYSAQNIW